jgi:hypothetical protein
MVMRSADTPDRNVIQRLRVWSGPAFRSDESSLFLCPSVALELNLSLLVQDRMPIKAPLRSGASFQKEGDQEAFAGGILSSDICCGRCLGAPDGIARSPGMRISWLHLPAVGSGGRMTRVTSWLWLVNYSLSTGPTMRSWSLLTPIILLCGFIGSAAVHISVRDGKGS